MATAVEDTKVSNRRNLYVRNEDLEVWEKAEQLAGDLSPLVSRLLRRYVEQREAAKDRIVVELDGGDGLVIRKAFQGRRLVDDFRTENPGAGARIRYYAAQGAKGGLAFWVEDDVIGHAFQTYDSFEDAVTDRDSHGIGWPQDFLSAVSSALGEDYAEEIDL